MTDLFAEFGVPHYLKCDIEGGEEIVIAQITQAQVRPSFISMEDPTGASASLLAAIGYDRFQMINQGYLPMFPPPQPPREGQYFDTTFDGRMSGLFGFELRPDHWIDEAALQDQMRRWRSLHDNSVNPVFRYAFKRWGKLTGRGWLIPGGWCDIHATTEATLKAR